MREFVHRLVPSLILPPTRTMNDFILPEITRDDTCSITNWQTKIPNLVEKSVCNFSKNNYKLMLVWK